MNVLDLLPDRFGLEEIAIEAAATLPEGIGPVDNSSSHPFQVRMVSSLQAREDRLGHGSFDRLEDVLHQAALGSNKKVDVFRHDHMGQYEESMLLPGFFERSEENALRLVILEEPPSPIARERQAVGMAFDVGGLPLLSRRIDHG